MYTWGYIKKVALVKLDISEQEATRLGHINSFPIYANEVITQIGSVIKAKDSYYTFKVWLEESSFEKDEEGNIKPNQFLVGQLIKMPNGFTSSSTNISYFNPIDLVIPSYITLKTPVKEATDEDFYYVTWNEIVCTSEGEYQIAYNSRWFFFKIDVPDSTVLEIPEDMLDCIPTYVAAKCLKSSNEEKSALMMNDFNEQFARIKKQFSYKPQGIRIKGNW